MPKRGHLEPGSVKRTTSGNLENSLMQAVKFVLVIVFNVYTQEAIQVSNFSVAPNCQCAPEQGVLFRKWFVWEVFGQNRCHYHWCYVTPSTPEMRFYSLDNS